MKYHDFNNVEVKGVFEAYNDAVRGALMALREIIFVTAEEYDEVGELEETLKWGNPSYLTYNPKSGTTIRLSQLCSNAEEYAMSVHCQSTLISEFKEVYPELKYDENRSVIFNIKETLPRKTVKHFIYLALSYHHRKKYDIGI